MSEFQISILFIGIIGIGSFTYLSVCILEQLNRIADVLEKK